MFRPWVSLLISVIFTLSASTASLDAAREYYSHKAYKSAASEYGALLSLNWPKDKLGEIYDPYTECLVSIGQCDLAERKINELLNILPNDPLRAKLLARKTFISNLRSGAAVIEPTNPDPVTQSYEARNYPVAIQLARESLAKSGIQSESNFYALRVLLESLAKSGQFQDQVDFIDQTLADHPEHPLYAELRRKQGDTLSNSLKQVDAGRAKYEEALARAEEESETYEHCAYRLSEIALAEAKKIASADPARAKDLIAKSDQYLNKFLNHPGADKLYPTNAKRRISALRKLKKFDDMEREAARYLNADNAIQYNEVVAIRTSLGEFVHFQQTYDPSTATPEQTAIHNIKMAYYAEDYANAINQAKAFLSAQPRGSAEYRQAQRLLIGSYVKSPAAQELIGYVDQALAAEPDHPMYADFRKAQADMLLDTLKQPSAAQQKYLDAMAHASKDSDVYDWSCFRAGEALYREAAPHWEINPALNAQLKARGRQYMQEYIGLPSKDRLYPANVKRRMTAYTRLGQLDLMELEAARYLSERGDYNKDVYMQIMSLLSTNRSMKQSPDDQIALMAFEDMRLHQQDFSDNNAKAYSGITMLKSAKYFEEHGSPKERVDQIRALGRKFLLDALKDDSIKPSVRLSAYYFLGDWVAMKAEVDKQLQATPEPDPADRAELLKLAGVALRYQGDITGALAYFDRTIVECERNPAVVGHRGVTAAYWGICIKLEQKDEAGARQYLIKMGTLPDSEFKTKLMNEYRYLLAK